jgi:hypothetical protein
MRKIISKKRIVASQQDLRFTREAKEHYIEDALQYSERVFDDIVNYAINETSGEFNYGAPFVKEHQISDQLNDDTDLAIEFNVYSELIDLKTGKLILEMWAGFIGGPGTYVLQYDGSINPRVVVKELQFIGY